MPQSYKKISLQELIILSQNKDLKALEELIKRIQKDVYATLSYMLNNNENISDITQEILVKVASHINDLKNPGCFRGWLNHIITNTYYDTVRKIKRKPSVLSVDFTCTSQDDKNFQIDIPDKHSKPIEKCITSECEKMIKSAIRTLPEAFKIAIILREFQGLSYEEIANMTKSSIGTVKSRISRARIKLQDVLKNYI